MKTVLNGVLGEMLWVVNCDNSWCHQPDKTLSSGPGAADRTCPGCGWLRFVTKRFTANVSQQSTLVGGHLGNW